MASSEYLLSAPREIAGPVKLEDADYPLGPAALSALLADVYDGVTETPPWHTVLERLREHLGASHVTLMLRPPSPESAGVMINTGDVDDSATESYETHFFALDPFVGLPDEVVITAEELIGTERWLQSAMYREYLEPLGIRHLLGADISTEEGVECRLRVTRSPEGAPFSEDDRNVVRAVLPHLRRAIRMHTKLDYLECERQLFSGAVNRLLLGMISFDADGAVLETNPEAERILAEKDGIVRSSKGLTAVNRAENKELQRLISEAIAGGSADQEPSVVEAMSITREAGRSQLGIVVRTIPLGRWSESRRRPAAVVFLRDPDSSNAQPSHDVVRRVFGLTRMEASLAILLADGYTLDEAAAELNVRRNTARTHLRSIFGKTGVTRQTMLVRMILNSVVSLG